MANKTEASALMPESTRVSEETNRMGLICLLVQDSTHANFRLRGSLYRFLSGSPEAVGAPVRDFRGVENPDSDVEVSDVEELGVGESDAEGADIEAAAGFVSAALVEERTQLMPWRRPSYPARCSCEPRPMPCSVLAFLRENFDLLDSNQFCGAKIDRWLDLPADLLPPDLIGLDADPNVFLSVLYREVNWQIHVPVRAFDDPGLCVSRLLVVNSTFDLKGGANLKCGGRTGPDRMVAAPGQRHQKRPEQRDERGSPKRMDGKAA